MEAFEQSIHATSSEPQFSSKEISNIYKSIKGSIKELEDTEKKQQNKQAIKCLVTFCKVMEKVAKDVVQAKERYENIDKQQLIDDRLLELATSINFFRTEAQNYNAGINQAEQEIKALNAHNQSKQFHNQCLKKALANRQSQRQRTKNIYITQQEKGRVYSSPITTHKLDIREFSYSQTPKQRLLMTGEKQAKTLASFNSRYTSKDGSGSKRSQLQFRKLQKGWEHSTKLTNQRESDS